MNELTEKYWVYKLKQIKEIEGFKTDKDLAIFMNVSTVTVHDYMIGKIKQMKSETLQYLRQKGYSYDWLLDDIGDPKKDFSAGLLTIKRVDNEPFMADIVEEKPAADIEAELPTVIEEKATEKIDIFDNPFVQHLQGESVFLRQLVTKLIINKD